MTTKRIPFTVSGVLLLPLLACSRGPELEPAATAAQPPGMEDAVVADERGVELIAVAEDWPGDANIEEEVTPLRVIIQNQSEQPIQIRYSSFKLTSPDGSTYSAIPPRQVSGVVEDEYVRPAFGYSGFMAAPYYGGYYSGIDPYPDSFYYDAPYYDSYYGYWDATTVLPTVEMISRGLPEGVLQPGGSLDGYVYFQKIDQPEGTLVTLQADLQASEGEQRVASLQMPFVVE